MSRCDCAECLARAAARVPTNWPKEKLIAFVEAAGIRWIPPDEDTEYGFPGGFDMCTLTEMGRLLTSAATLQTRTEEPK